MSRVRQGVYREDLYRRIGHRTDEFMEIDNIILEGDATPALVDQRAKDIKPWGKHIVESHIFKDHTSYVRDDRFLGGVGRDGFNWGPGYMPYLKISVLKRKLRLRFLRPYPPELTDATITRLTRSLTHWLLTGELVAP